MAPWEQGVPEALCHTCPKSVIRIIGMHYLVESVLGNTRSQEDDHQWQQGHVYERHQNVRLEAYAPKEKAGGGRSGGRAETTTVTGVKRAHWFEPHTP